MVEHLSGVCKAMGSIASIPKKGEKEGEVPSPASMQVHDPRSQEGHLKCAAVKPEVPPGARRKPALSRCPLTSTHDKQVNVTKTGFLQYVDTKQHRRILDKLNFPSVLAQYVRSR